MVVIGYGKFGAALVGLARERGIRCGAWDAERPVPDPVGVALQACTTAAFVILAVPVPAIRRAAQAIKPWLGRHTVVLDVGSVKVEPTDILRDVYGNDTAWVPAHPLFGPASLARGEHPRRVVLCAADTPHAAAAAAVRDLFERLGCVVVDVDAHAHDRKMADSHALAFFVARGIVELGIDVEEPLAPPSFQAMATTVRTVREDAGHLFDVLQNHNPYAASMRERYLDVLHRLHEGLKDS
jgi:prephenate dehydrogenase